METVVAVKGIRNRLSVVNTQLPKFQPSKITHRNLFLFAWACLSEPQGIDQRREQAAQARVVKQGNESSAGRKKEEI